MINELPDPVLTQIYRLKAVVGPVHDVGRRFLPLTGGTFTGPELTGKLMPGGSVSWRLASPDGVVRVEVEYTLETDRGALLYVHSTGTSERCDANVDSGAGLLRATTHIETAAPDLDWLNNGVLVTVARRTPANMLHEIYLLG